MEASGKPKEHQLHLDKRQKLSMTGITSVGTFNETEILLDSNMGNIALKGEGMHITQLNLEEERLMVEGKIRAIIYLDAESKSTKGKNILERILR